jgi:hypothetical protein
MSIIISSFEVCDGRGGKHTYCHVRFLSAGCQGTWGFDALIVRIHCIQREGGESGRQGYRE